MLFIGPDHNQVVTEGFMSTRTYNGFMAIASGVVFGGSLVIIAGSLINLFV